MRVTRWALAATGVGWIMYLGFLTTVAPPDRSPLHSGMAAAMATGTVLVGSGALARWAVRRLEATARRPDPAPDLGLDPEVLDAGLRISRRLQR